MSERWLERQALQNASMVRRTRQGWRLLCIIGVLCCLVFWFDVGISHAAELQQQTVGVDLTVGSDQGFCATTDAIAVLANTPIYFCISLINQSQSPLTRHTIAVPQLSLQETFTTTLQPGEQLNLTTGILRELGGSTALETTVFDATSQVGQTIVYSATVTSLGGGIEYENSATASVVYGQVGFGLRQTVGTNATNCATTTSNIAVPSGTAVYFCLQITEAAIANQLEIEEYSVSAPELGVSRVLTTPLATNPFFIGDATVTAPFTSNVTVIGRTAAGVTVSESAVARVVPGNSALQAQYTVGIEPDECATTTTRTVTTGTMLYYCIQLTNTGSLPLVRHAYTTTVNQQTKASDIFTQTVMPGATVRLTQAMNSGLAYAVSTGETSQLAVTSYTQDEIPAAAEASTTVSIGSVAFTFNKYARTDPTGCVNTAPLEILTTQNFYYCVVIRNTGAVPLTNFTVTEPTYNINFSFDYTLGVNEVITLTNTTLPNYNLGQNLGPFIATGSIIPSMTIIAGTRSGASTTFSQSFQINARAPTTTPSPVPTSTYTPIPTATPTLTPSLTPLPTPTPTNVVPSILPTPTDPTSLNSITSPGSTGQEGGFVSPLETPPISPLETPTEPVDFFATEAAATLEAANAATATDVALTAIAASVQAGTATAEAFAFAATETALAMQPTVTETAVPTATPSDTPSPTPTAELAAVVLTAPAETLTTAPSAGTTGTNADYLSVLLMSFATSTVTLGWIWFLVGSVIFFAVAGMFAGLSFRQREDERYQMAESPFAAQDELALFDDWSADDGMVGMGMNDADVLDTAGGTSNHKSPSAQSMDPTDDDFWPASLR